MVSSAVVAARFSSPAVIANMHGGLAIHAQAPGVASVSGIFLRLGLEHLAQAVAIAIQNLRHATQRRQLRLLETQGTQLLQRLVRRQPRVRQTRPECRVLL